jgi:exosortase/archaeosortase family protein
VPTLTQFDTMLVGSVVKLTIGGATWQGNVISVPGDHSIEIVAGCCSFRNVSLAALCWIALTKLERPEWRSLDIVVLATAAGCQIGLNVVRIYLMALSDDMYLYWHTGMGAHIFAIVASVGAVLISAFGARLVSLRSATRPLADVLSI